MINKFVRINLVNSSLPEVLRAAFDRTEPLDSEVELPEWQPQDESVVVLTAQRPENERVMLLWLFYMGYISLEKTLFQASLVSQEDEKPKFLKLACIYAHRAKVIKDVARDLLSGIDARLFRMPFDIVEGWRVVILGTGIMPVDTDNQTDYKSAIWDRSVPVFREPSYAEMCIGDALA